MNENRENGALSPCQLLKISLALILCLTCINPALAERTTTYFHTDALGSVVAASDESGNLLWRKSYSPYGQQIDTDTDNEALSYTGKPHDEDTGLTYFGARYYDPQVGRFMGMDPADVREHIGSNPMLFNRYAYGNNNPYRYVDPTGEVPLDTLWDGANVIYDIGKITVGWTIGNQQMVISGGVDLAGDLTALAIPYFPAGATKVLGAAGKQAAKGTKRNPNKLEPVKDADGPHTSFRRDADGKVSNYETYDKNPYNGQWSAEKRFRGSGKEHGGVEPPFVLERADGKGPGSKPVVPRKPDASELPKGY